MAHIRQILNKCNALEIKLKLFCSNPFYFNIFYKLNCKFIMSSNSVALLCSEKCFHFVDRNTARLLSSSALHTCKLACFPCTLSFQIELKQDANSQEMGRSNNSRVGMLRMTMSWLDMSGK